MLHLTRSCMSIILLLSVGLEHWKGLFEGPCFFCKSGNNVASEKVQGLCSSYSHCPRARPSHVGKSSHLDQL